VAEELQLPAEMMCADAGLHADQTWRQENFLNYSKGIFSPDFAGPE
jgi:hypothetical protein